MWRTDVFLCGLASRQSDETGKCAADKVTESAVSTRFKMEVVPNVGSRRFCSNQRELSERLRTGAAGVVIGERLRPGPGSSLASVFGPVPQVSSLASVLGPVPQVSSLASVLGPVPQVSYWRAS